MIPRPLPHPTHITRRQLQKTGERFLKKCKDSRAKPTCTDTWASLGLLIPQEQGMLFVSTCNYRTSNQNLSALLLNKNCPRTMKHLQKPPAYKRGVNKPSK